MPVLRGTTPIPKCYRGGVEVSAIYRGTALVWAKAVATGFTTATVQVDAGARSFLRTSIETGGTATAKTFNAPIASQAGDLLLAYLTVDSGTLPTAASLPPAGWTEIGRVTPTTAGHPRVAVLYKVATAGEPATYTFGTLPTTMRGCVLCISIKDWSGNTAQLGGFATSATNNNTLNTPTITPATSRSLMLTSVSAANTSGWTWGWIPPAGHGSLGYAAHSGGFAACAVGHEKLAGTAATGTRTWTVNTGSTQNVRMTTTLAIPSGTRTATLTEFLSSAFKTGGSGGELTAQIGVPFEDSAGTTSTYHLYADGLDWTKNVGLMVYGDGSGEFGLVNPTDDYLIEGIAGLRAVCKRQNMVLLTPRAPGDGCRDEGGVCWYDHSFNGVTPHQKLEWSNEVIRFILTQYDIDRRRIALGGYSSGSQWLTSWFGPRYASDIMLDGVAVAISYGGQPMVAPRITPEYRAAVEHIWDCGDLDTAWTQPTWENGVQTGRAWYQKDGFAVTDLVLVAGVPHERYNSASVGVYGAIMEREIVKRVPGDGSVEPTTGLRPVVYRSHTNNAVIASNTNKATLSPGIIRAGDLILAVFSVYSGTVASAALPAGFTLLQGYSRSTAHRTFVGYKIATANEPATYTPTLSTNTTMHHRVDYIVLGNVDTTRLGTVGMITTPANAATHTAPSVNPTTNNGMLVSWVSGASANEWTAPAGMEEVTDSQTGATVYLTQSVAIESITSNAATGTRPFSITTPTANSFTHIAGSLFVPSLESA